MPGAQEPQFGVIGRKFESFAKTRLRGRQGRRLILV